MLGGSSFAQLNASEKFLYVNTTPRLSSSPAKELPPSTVILSVAKDLPPHCHPAQRRNYPSRTVILSVVKDLPPSLSFRAERGTLPFSCRMLICFNASCPYNLKGKVPRRPRNDTVRGEVVPSLGWMTSAGWC